MGLVLGERVNSSGAGQYLFAAIVFSGVYILLRMFKHRLVRHLHFVARDGSSKINNPFIDIINKINWPFYMVFSIFVGIQFLDLPDRVFNVIGYVVVVIGTYYAVRAAESLVDFGLKHVLKKKEKEGEDVDESALRLIGGTVKGIIWAGAILLVLQNLGYNVSALIAGLGIGGVAIGLALKNILGDIFASFSIYLDKPFKTGDFIIVGDDKGTVEYIGIKSTRIRTLEGDELVVSNEELTDSRVHNYKKLERRRGHFKIGVTYDTPVRKLKKIPGIISLIIEGVEKTKLSRVHFAEFGDYALIYEIVYFLDDNNYKLYMDIQQDINLKILEAFEKESIEMAFPTQTVYLKNNSL